MNIEYLQNIFSDVGYKQNECTMLVSGWKGYIHIAWEEGMDVKEMPTGRTLDTWEHTPRVDLHVSHDL